MLRKDKNSRYNSSPQIKCSETMFDTSLREMVIWLLVMSKTRGEKESNCTNLIQVIKLGIG